MQRPKNTDWAAYDANRVIGFSKGFAHFRAKHAALGANILAKRTSQLYRAHQQVTDTTGSHVALAFLQS